MNPNLKFLLLVCLGMVVALAFTVVLVRDSFRRAKQYDELRRNLGPGEAGGVRNPDASGERDEAVKDTH